MLATEIVRQGEFACEKACSCADGVISRRGNDQATTFFNQLNLPPCFEPSFRRSCRGIRICPFDEILETGIETSIVFELAYPKKETWSIYKTC
jgi:hypothetical protein